MKVVFYWAAILLLGVIFGFWIVENVLVRATLVAFMILFSVYDLYKTFKHGNSILSSIKKWLVKLWDAISLLH